MPLMAAVISEFRFTILIGRGLISMKVLIHIKPPQYKITSSGNFVSVAGGELHAAFALGDWHNIWA